MPVRCLTVTAAVNASGLQSGATVGGRRAHWARRACAVVAVGSASLVAGCYELRPTMQIEPQPAVEFKFELTDAARVAVADKLGAEVRDVTGQVIRREGDDVTMAVREVTYLKGDLVQLQGAVVHFNRQQLASVNERSLSLSKSMLLAGAVAVAVGVLVGSKSLFGSGGPSTDGSCSGLGCGPTTTLHP